MKGKLVFGAREIREKGGLAVTEEGPVADFLGGEATGGSTRAPHEEWRPDFVSGSCRVTLEFSVGGERILLEGRVAVRWVLECSRCLAEHAVDFEHPLEETFPATAEALDAGEEVRQALILSVPERSLCRPDCRGLCPRCGGDLNKGPCRCG